MRRITRKVKRGLCCSGCLFVILLIAIPFYMLFKPAPPAPVISKIKQTASIAHVKEVRKELAEIKSDVKTAKPHPFTLVLSEDDINTFILTDLETKNLISVYKLENVFVKIEDNTVKAYGSRWVRGMHINGTMTVVPELTPERTMRLKMEAISLGALGLPPEFATQITKELTKVIVEKLFDPTLKFKSLEIKGSNIIGTGDTK